MWSVIVLHIEGREGEEGAPHVPPQKTFCNVKTTKIEDPLPHFFTTPWTPSKQFENDCASMALTQSDPIL